MLLPDDEVLLGPLQALCPFCARPLWQPDRSWTTGPQCHVLPAFVLTTTELSNPGFWSLEKGGGDGEGGGNGGHGGGGMGKWRA